jgi:hypothetical protein
LNFELNLLNEEIKYHSYWTRSRLKPFAWNMRSWVNNSNVNTFIAILIILSVGLFCMFRAGDSSFKPMSTSCCHQP